MDPRSIAVVALFVLLAGCSGYGQGQATTTHQTTSTAPITTTTAKTDSTVTRDSPPKGTQFVSTTRLANQSRSQGWPDNQSVHYQNLSEERQRVFAEALDHQVKFGPDENNPFSFYNKSRPSVVRYNGTWYYVQVAIV